MPTLKGQYLHDYKNFLNTCQQILGLKYWGIHPKQARLFEKLSLLWATWGAQHLKGLFEISSGENQKWILKQSKVMTQENKELLLKYLCMALPYGIKILHTGWDCDSGTDFDTVETLIGIDDKFIYTVWDKTGDRKKHCLSVSNWKPYLRSMSSMTEEEINEFILISDTVLWLGNKGSTCILSLEQMDWLLEHHLDFMGLIPKDLAIEVTENNNPYKE